ncbi:MAG: glycosyltransferase [Cyclobacteriaceae bacterium]
MIVFLVLSAVYVAVFIWLTYHWVRIQHGRTVHSEGVRFSVLIPVRNESKNIRHLLLDLNEQHYALQDFEVIVIDDDSSDGTKDAVEELIGEVGYKLRCIQLSDKSGKKAALTEGISQASNEIILATDGDCRVGSNWIAAYAACYKSENISMIAGPVRMIGNNLIGKFQKLEFASLIGFGAAAISSGNPSTCNGANMSYRKKVFLEVNGYEGNEGIPSGDDEFLLQKINASRPGQIVFLKNRDAIVETPAKETISELFNQRIRWTSKWQFHKNWFARFSTVYVFIDYLTYIIFLALALFNFIDLRVFIAILAVRFLSVTIYQFSIARFFRFSFSTVVGLGLTLQIIYPLFVALLGIASIFGSYSWKGRKY